MSRPFLLTVFRCASCGGPLGLVYQKDVSEVARQTANSWVSERDPGIENVREPTGADMVSNMIYIAPCYNCQQPLRDLESGVAKLRKVLKVYDK